MRFDPATLVQVDHTGDWRKFAKLMFMLEDADPGYVLLKRAEMPHAQKLRYVLAWCTFYNPGVAAAACQHQGTRFYDYLKHVYDGAKRATERRHFRGRAGRIALAQWEQLYPKPEAMIEACYAPTYMGVRKNMKHMAQMGDYFYWKLADVWDTVFDQTVEFTGCEKYMPKLPKQGADLIYGLEQPVVTGHNFKEEQWLVPVMRAVTDHVRAIPYPLKNGRRLELQEAETVCCVFKQHNSGSYRYGFRSAKAYRRLLAAREEAPRTSRLLLEGLYAGGIWTPEELAAVGEYL